jgi:Immunity protein 26
MITNEIREYFGIKIIEDKWKRLPLKGTIGGFVFIDENNILRKFIYFSDDSIFHREVDHHIEMKNDNEIVGSKGKVQKLSYSVLEKFKPHDISLFINERSIELVNCKNGVALINEQNLNLKKQEEVFSFFTNKIENSTDFEKEELTRFKADTNFKAQKFVSGDIFRVNLGGNRFAYGRVIADLKKFEKYELDKKYEWELDWRGRVCLEKYGNSSTLVDLFLNTTDNPNLKYEDLKDLKLSPSWLVRSAMFTNYIFRIVDNCNIEVNTFELPMDYETIYNYVPIYHIFKWGAGVIPFAPNDKFIELKVQLFVNIFEGLGVSVIDIEAKINLCIENSIEFDTLTFKKIRHQETYLQMAEVISQAIGFDIKNENYDSFASKFGFMTKSEIINFCKKSKKY